MNDMSRVITPKSDQLNSDDLIAGPRTIRISNVSIRPGTEQPVSIHFDGDDNKPWKPCKSMSRVLVFAWGADAKAYVGRSLTLYRDPKVKWGGMEVGGIRISHMSDIEAAMTVVLTATQKARAPYTVKPLARGQEQAKDDVTLWAEGLVSRISSAASASAILAIENEGVVIKRRQYLAEARPELAKMIDDALAAGPQGRADEDHGDQFYGDDV